MTWLISLGPAITPAEAAFAFIGLIALNFIARILVDALRDKPAPQPEDEIHGEASHLGREL